MKIEIDCPECGTHIIVFDENKTRVKNLYSLEKNYCEKHNYRYSILHKTEGDILKSWNRKKLCWYCGNTKNSYKTEEYYKCH